MEVSTSNKISCAGGLALAAALFIAAQGFPERAVSAALYVKFLSVCLFLLSGILMAQTLLSPVKGKTIEWVKNPRKFLITTGAMVVYVVLLYVIGFFPASILMMIGLARGLGYKKWKPLIIGALVMMVFIYLLFVQFLAVPVPAGLLGEVF